MEPRYLFLQTNLSAPFFQNVSFPRSASYVILERELPES